MLRWLPALLAGVLLAGCEVAAAPPEPTARSQQSPPTVAPAPPTAVPPTTTSVPPTLTPVPPTSTPMPPTATPAPPTATPTLSPTLTATQVVQQSYCDTASPPAHLPLPISAPTIRITPPGAPSQALPARGGPRREGGDPPPNVTSLHVAVVDEGSGVLLYDKDPFARAAPASITKIVTTIVALEKVPDVARMFTTSVSASALVACDGSSVMGLEPNDHVKLETLLYGMMLPSGNDAAEQVAVSLAGSRDAYVGWMNDKVAGLGLRDTHFVTPSGMDADEHYSSAYDMAMLGRYAMQNPAFRQIAGTPFFVGDQYYMHNLNPLLGSYAGADGVKIGYTEIAGRTIVGSASRDGHRVYVSLLGSRNLLGDCSALFDWVWKVYRW